MLNCDDEADELRAQAAADKRYRARIARAPHCDDPDHPGCWRCDDEEVVNEEENDE